MGNDIPPYESAKNPVLTKNLNHEQNILPLSSVLHFKVKKEKEEGPALCALHSIRPGWEAK